MNAENELLTIKTQYERLCLRIWRNILEYRKKLIPLYKVATEVLYGMIHVYTGTFRIINIESQRISFKKRRKK
jgi:hypothetical protein